MYLYRIQPNSSIQPFNYRTSEACQLIRVYTNGSISERNIRGKEFYKIKSETQMKMSKIISILFLMLAYFNVCEANSPKVICFYANWAQFRPGIGRFLPQSIDPKLCTHVTYAHLKIDLSSHRLAQRQKNDHILLAQINDLKKINPLLKVIISVGEYYFLYFIIFLF